MKRLLLIIGILTIGLSSYAQNNGDFSAFGNEVLDLKNKVEIYPNPSVDFLNVTISNADLVKTEIVVYSIIGSKYQIEIEKTEQDQYRLDVRNLPPGYYLLSIKDPTTNFSKTYKFLKK